MNLERERQLIERMGTRLVVERDLRDFYAHGEIVSELAVLVAKTLGEDEHFCNDIAVAGMLHDIGKLELADVIYGHRDDILAVERSKYVRMHPTLGIDASGKAIPPEPAEPAPAESTESEPAKRTRKTTDK